MRVSVSVDDGAGGAVVSESFAGWTATARLVPGDGAEVRVWHQWRGRPVTFGAYLLRGVWMCHGLGRSALPSTAKQLGRRVLRRLPTVPT